jgi:CBS domain-containing protein
MPHTLLPNIIEFISQIDPFDKLPANLQRQIAKSVSITYLARGEQIDFSSACETRYLYIIRTGVMEQRKSDGVLRAKLGPEDLFGFTFLEPQANAEDGYTAKAIESSLLYLVPHVELQLLMKEHPQYAEHFASQAQIRLQSALNVVWSDNEKGLFVRKVSEVFGGAPAIVSSNMTIRQVAREMRIVLRSSSAVVKENGQIVGIITDRDMTKRVIAEGVSIDRPISEVMTRNPLTIRPDDLVLKAASLMMQHNVRCLPVVSGNRVHGLLTTTHLVQNHRIQAIFLIEKIKYATKPKELVALTSERQAIFEAFVEGKVRSEIIGQVMAMIYDAYNRRLIQMAEEKFGAPPCEYAWIVAGSHARNEIHILSDQDSAIIMDDSATDEDRQYFLKLADYVCNQLAECGFPLCSGHYMAVTPKWCQRLSVWKEYYRKWVSNPEYDMLLNASVFLEVRPIHGRSDFSNTLQDYLHELIQSEPAFLTSLVNDSISVHPPLGIFNNLVLEKSGDNSNTLNIKKYAITLIVDLARIYGLSVGCSATETEERFRYAYEKGLLSEDALKNIIGAYRFILQLRFANQLEALKRGDEPNSNIAPDKFGSFERKHLKDAFRIIANLQDAAKLRFSQG